MSQLTFHNGGIAVRKGLVDMELDRPRWHFHSWLGISIDQYVNKQLKSLFLHAISVLFCSESSGTTYLSPLLLPSFQRQSLWNATSFHNLLTRRSPF
jgi:hypothetical protein